MAMKAQCAKLRETLTGLLSAAADGVEAEPLQEACQLGKLLLMEMKEANRTQCERMEALREDTAESKSELEALNLKLQNLLYEKSYYQKEIATCEDFKSKYPDEEVALLSLEQYAQETGVLDAVDDHDTMLKRLTHEAQRRKALHAQLQALRAEQAAAEAEGERQSAFLKTLGEQLKGVSSAADSVKASLRVPRGAMAFLSPHAELLPLPMYVLYSQLAACIDAHGLPAEVRINGSLDEAEVVANEAARAHARADPALDQRVKMEEDGDAMDTGRRHGAAEHDGSPDVQPPKNDLYTRHPLDVVLSLHRSKEGRTPLMAITFHYLTVLNVVTVEAEDAGDNVYLANLFPGDTGAQSPNEANNQLQGGHFQFDLTMKARPYRWAQHLAGMDFLPAVASQPTRAQSALNPSSWDGVHEGMVEYRQQGRHLSVISQLRERKLSCEGLKTQLAALSSLKLPTLKGRPPLPAPQCRLSAWTEASGTGGGAPMLLSAAYSRLLGSSAVSATQTDTTIGVGVEAEEGELGSGGEAGGREAISTALQELWQQLGMRCFNLQLKRGDVVLQAQVEVTLEYPVRAPRLLLRKMWWPAVEGASTRSKGSSLRLPESELKAFEAEVNALSANLLTDPALAPHAATELLTRQIALLMSAFDVYAEEASVQRAIHTAGAPMQPPVSRGRDMRRAILMHPATGTRSYASP